MERRLKSEPGARGKECVCDSTGVSDKRLKEEKKKQVRKEVEVPRCRM